MGLRSARSGSCIPRVSASQQMTRWGHWLDKHYVTSKGGIVAFTRALSRELGPHNICVNTLAPGLIQTEGTHANSDRRAAARDRAIESRALKRDGYPAELIGALIFLAAGDSDFVTGQTIVVDGGSINT
ncbi:SDR family oxidoreductase (plasmid) [Bradyrhizobium sp. CB82]|uniref:SDR family oxidoreductase n=1 Tax=Bradyrhizobium sp. CB82 TaxID=3039159 RepID=UPI0024B04D8D|nr:SDR family oxidoreductase [Bradyrhizobium sp. CB82]WFU45460.1 SDR family oxidoreductase [Bradyrhizobium sp. CB82]